MILMNDKEIEIIKEVAEEEGMNNFRKGDVVTVGDIKGDEILLEGLAYIDRQFVDLYFE